MAEDAREIRSEVGEGEVMTREQLAEWWLSYLTKGDIQGYADKVRARIRERAGAAAV